MANFFVTLYDDVKKWFEKVFTSVKSKAPAIIATVNGLIPSAEAIFALVDPAAAALADPIITEIQADLGSIVALAKSGGFSSIGGFVSAISANFDTLLTEAHIKDANALAEAKAIFSAIQAALQSLAAAA